VTVTGTAPETPCQICGEALNPEIPPGMDASPFTRTVHPQCADRRAAEYVAAGRPWRAGAA
jgi:hypothetical protein